jgi:hypothetical protein
VRSKDRTDGGPSWPAAEHDSPSADGRDTGRHGDDRDTQLGFAPGAHSDMESPLVAAVCHGEMAERLKAHAWKACVRASVPRVRIPVSPPVHPHNTLSLRRFWSNRLFYSRSPQRPGATPGTGINDGTVLPTARGNPKSPPSPLSPQPTHPCRPPQVTVRRPHHDRPYHSGSRATERRLPCSTRPYSLAHVLTEPPGAARHPHPQS